MFNPDIHFFTIQQLLKENSSNISVTTAETGSSHKNPFHWTFQRPFHWTFNFLDLFHVKGSDKCGVKTAFSLKSQWSSSYKRTGQYETGRVAADGSPKGPASQMSLWEPIRGARPHPPLDWDYISPQPLYALYLLCTAINAKPSWRPVFQFLISLLRHIDT